MSVGPQGEGLAENAFRPVLEADKVTEAKVRQQVTVLFAHLNNPHGTWRQVGRVYARLERMINALPDQKLRRTFHASLRPVRAKMRELNIPAK